MCECRSCTRTAPASGTPCERRILKWRTLRWRKHSCPSPPGLLPSPKGESPPRVCTQIHTYMQTTRIHTRSRVILCNGIHNVPTFAWEIHPLFWDYLYDVWFLLLGGCSFVLMCNMSFQKAEEEGKKPRSKAEAARQANQGKQQIEAETVASARARERTFTEQQ